MRSTLFCLVILSGCSGGIARLDNGKVPVEPGPLETPLGPPPAMELDAGVVEVDAGQPVPVPVPLIDGAELVAMVFPSDLSCAEQATAQVTMRNTGTSTWTKALGFRLGAVDDSDPLAASTRIDLDDTAAVLPNGSVTFTVRLAGAMSTSSAVSDWRMVHDGVQWFGAIGARSIATNCPPPGADAIDLSQVEVFNSPTDVASWPITTQITQIEMSRANNFGLGFTFPALANWPDYTPPGWDGPLQYTVWAVVSIGGRWYTSGYIQMWNGRPSTGAPLLTDFAANWAYDGRWGPMMGHQPQVGERVGFFVTAGNARGVPTVTSLRERSNVVVVALPVADEGVFNF